MKKRLDVTAPKTQRDKYDFTTLRPNESWHVDTNAERVRVLSAFTYWAKNIRKVQAKATSQKVDETDPDGAGYRIWFVSTRSKPAAGQPAMEASGNDI